jgi:hypothetical protein
MGELLLGDLITTQVGESPSTMDPTPVMDTTIHEEVTEGEDEVVVAAATDEGHLMTSSTSRMEDLRLRTGSLLRPVHQASAMAYRRLRLRRTMVAGEAPVHLGGAPRPLLPMGCMETMVALLEILLTEVRHNNHLTDTRARARDREEVGGPINAKMASIYA